MTKSVTSKIRFTLAEAQAAADNWRFNCGPAAICAVLGLTPDEVRLYLGDFEKKGYTNPTLMTDSLARLGASYQLTYRSDKPADGPPPIKHGVARIQFSGPWTKPGVPMPVRYKHTHWVAVHGQQVFDINAICTGGWVSWSEWSTKIIPWLIKECCPKGDGGWWYTHALEVTP